MSVKLEGLTVVLLAQHDSADVKYGLAGDAALEAFLRAKQLGSDVRVFSVGAKLVELLHKPESLAWLGHVEAVQMSSAVNRVNILRPARIVVVTPEAVASRLGRARPDTPAYFWSAVDPLSSIPFWAQLHCEPQQIPVTIRSAERPAQSTEAH